MKNELMGTIYIVISAICFGLLAIVAKYAYAEGVSVNTLMLLRFTLGAVILWGYVVYKKLSIKLPVKDLVFLIIMGFVGYTAQSKLFFTSLETISASLAALLLYSYPALVTLIAFFLKIEKLSMQKIFALFFSGIGLLLVLGISANSFDLKGASFAFSAALVYSIYILAGNRINKRVIPLVMTTVIISSASFSYIFINIFENSFTLSLTIKGWAIISLLAAISTMAIVTFFLGLERLGPSKASIISTFEPIITILAATILFAEQLTFVQVIGGTLILLSVVFLQIKTKKVAKSLPENSPQELPQ